MITVLIAGDEKYRPYVENGKKTTEALGYPTLIYDLGNSGIGKKFNTRVSHKMFQTFPGKPAVMLDALEYIPENEYLVYLDADAIIQRKIDEICQDYDLAVTLRKQPMEDPRGSSINAGIIFVRNTSQAKEFLKIWSKLADELNGDQWALNKLTNFIVSDVDKTIICNNTKIHCFPCTIYNNFYFGDDQSQAKILHYKMSAPRKNLYPEYPFNQKD